MEKTGGNWEDRKAAGHPMRYGLEHPKGVPVNRLGDTEATSITTGWAPSCQCNAPTTPCTVLDPFCGSGTTLQVAVRLGRHTIGVDLSTEYLSELVPDRMDTVSTEPVKTVGSVEDWHASPLFAEVTT